MEEYDAPPEIQDAPTQQEEWGLGSGDALTNDELCRPPWLSVLPPKKRPFKWPSGGKSPSWFKKIAACQLQHAHRYRRRLKDPTGLLGAVGNVIHGAIEDAANIRARPGRRGQIPLTAGPRELLYLLELQADAVRQDLNVIEGEQASIIVTSEVLARAREIVSALQPIDLSNLWVEPRTGKAGSEFIWSFHITPQFVVAGIADLIQAVPDPKNFNAPPTRVIVSDWKTGLGQMPSREELALDAQAGLQLCWARRAFPRTPRIQFRLVNLALRKEVWVDWTPGLDQLVLSFARSCWHIWQLKQEDARVGTHCAYCPYRESCGPYEKYLRDSSFMPAVSLEGMDTSALVHAWHRAKIVSALSETRRIDAGKRLLEKMGRQKTYRAGNLMARKKSKRVPQYRDEAGLMIELAEQTGTSLEAVINNACQLRKKGLEGWIKTLPVTKQKIARDLIDQHQSLNHTPPWIEVSEKEPVI